MLLSSIFSRSGLRRASTSLAVQILALFLVTTLVPLVVGFIQSRDDVLAAEQRATENALSVADNAAGDIEGDYPVRSPGGSGDQHVAAVLERQR
jgi:hypothetical protein